MMRRAIPPIAAMLIVALLALLVPCASAIQFQPQSHDCCATTADLSAPAIRDCCQSSPQQPASTLRSVDAAKVFLDRRLLVDSAPATALETSAANAAVAAPSARVPATILRT